jgi:hypothetical protein
MALGPHLLAPTGALRSLHGVCGSNSCAAHASHGAVCPAGSDLARYNETGTVFAGFHYGKRCTADDVRNTVCLTQEAFLPRNTLPVAQT